MKPLGRLLPAFFSALALACNDAATAPQLSPPGTVSTARSATIPIVRLAVSVSDTDSTGSSYNIQSDGNGVYSDGVDDVQAVLDASGTFAFNTQSRRNRNAIRWVAYNFNDPLDAANAYRPNPSNLNNYHFSTGTSQFAPFIPIQNLGVDGNPVSQCIYMGNSLANATTSWRVSFHKGNEDVSDSPTAYAVVTRTSVSPAVWTIRPTGSCSPNSNVASLRSGDGTVLHGYYHLPFLLTLRAK